MEWRLWADLWNRSERFESAHDAEHVEDCLTNKRVVWPDEWSQLYDQLIEKENWVPQDIMELKAIDQSANGGHILQILLGKIAQVNRLRQSYLALRDWMKRRPW
jgi:hypothetical protein